MSVSAEPFTCRSRRGRLAVVLSVTLAAMLLGAGCAGTEGVAEGPAPADPPAATQAAGTPPIPVPAPPRPQPPKPRAKAPAAKPAEDAAAAAAAAAAMDAPVPPLQPLAVRLKGLSEAEAETLLGRPAAVEEKAPARIWTYRAGECSLRLGFFPQVQTLDFRVLSVEAAPRGDTAAEARCDAALLAARGGAAS